MNCIKRTLFRALLSATVFATTARAGDSAPNLSTNFVDVSSVEIDAKPARMIFMSSLSITLLMDEGAQRLGVKGNEISRPTPVTAGGQTFKVPFIIFENPLKQIPWHIRLLANVTHPILYHQFKNLLKEVSTGLEGVLGWPEVRDNILVFDAEQRTIRRVEQLPPETSGWLKLRIVPARNLILELPMPNGKTNALFVDTGDSRSVIVPSAAWNEWRAAHPRALVKSHKAIGLPLFITTRHTALAEEISMGPITLTNVAIADAEGSDDVREMPNADASWGLGMNALTRLDLVVDGKNGWAYLHPKPKPSAALPAAASQTSNGNWTVASNVRLSQDNFFVYTGEIRWTRSGFTNAEADFNRALKLNPNNADAYSDRGAIREILGDFAGATADYDKVIELRPGYSQNERIYRHSLLWRLAASPKEEERTDSAEEIKSTSPVELNPVVVYGTAPDGVPGCDTGWEKTIGQFLVGKLAEKDFLAVAKKSGDNEKKARAYYFIGIKHLSKGDQAGARVWFQKCQGIGTKDDNEYYFAVAELKRLGKPEPR
jgi:tetratricopeptide (TPR) repeat protein